MIPGIQNRLPKSVPGTRCDSRLDASKQGPKSVPGTRCGARSDASKQEPKSVPGTRCDARSDASKQAAQIGARHPVRRQVDACKQGAQIGASHSVRRCEMMKGKTNRPCESWPAKVRHCVGRCLKGIVPKCSIKPKPVQQVVPPVE